MMGTVSDEMGGEVFFDVAQTQQMMDQNAQASLAAAQAALSGTGATITVQSPWGPSSRSHRGDLRVRERRTDRAW